MVRGFEMFDCGVDSCTECGRIFRRDRIGADQLDLLIEALLLGEDQREIVLCLSEPLLTFSQCFEQLATRGEQAFLSSTLAPRSAGR